MAARRAGSPVAEERSLQDLLADATSELSLLIRKEMELAKIETKEQFARAGRAAGLFAGTALLAYLAVLLLSFAAVWGLAEVVPTGLAFLIVGAIYGVVAGLFFVQARKRAAEVRPIPQQTVETLKEDVEWAKAMKQTR